MKRFFLLCTLLTLLGSSAVWSQSEEAQVASIRKIYNRVQQEIASMQPGNPNNPYYVVEVTENALHSSYPAVGNYLGTTRFYYTYKGGEEPQLAMVVISKEVAAAKIYQECLFQAGQCIFFYCHDSYETPTDKRLYMTPTGKTVRYVEGNSKPYPGAETSESIMREWANDYLTTFKYIMGWY